MTSFRDAFIDESHKKEDMRLYITNSHEAQNLMGYSTPISTTHSKMPLIEVNHIKLHESQGRVAHNTRQSNYRWQCQIVSQSFTPRKTTPQQTIYSINQSIPLA